MKSLKLIYLSALPRKSNRIFFKEHILFYRTSLLDLTCVWSHVFYSITLNIHFKKFTTSTQSQAEKKQKIFLYVDDKDAWTYRVKLVLNNEQYPGRIFSTNFVYFVKKR